MNQAIKNVILALVAIAVCCVLVWIYKHPEYRYKPESIEFRDVAIWVIGGIMMFGALCMLLWWLWWKTGRLKWMVIGVLAFRCLDAWYSSITFILVAATIAVLAWRDDVLLKRGIDYEL